MFEAVFDSCVLIDYEEAASIGILAKHFARKAYVTRHVREGELGKGITQNKPDPCIHDGAEWIATIDLNTDEYQLADELTLLLGKRHRGEAESIAVGYFRKLAFCSRDRNAIVQATERGVHVVSSAGILNMLVRDRSLSFAQAVAVTKGMAHRGIDERLLIEPV